MKFFQSFFVKQEPAHGSESAETERSVFYRLKKSRNQLSGGIRSLFSSAPSVDDDFFEELEDQLLIADFGVSASHQLVESVREFSHGNSALTANELVENLRNQIGSILHKSQGQDLQLNPESDRPFVILMVGVNGVGKTTTCAKLASKAKLQGHNVVLAACDTFRAAAIEQLQTWGDRLDIPVVAQSHGSDAAAVAFDAFDSARAKTADLLIIDSAGRQHTHTDLMEQLKKIKRVLQKAHTDIPDEIWLTVDAGNGQNVLSQVESFHNAVGLTGLCVTKLDGTAKGGVIVSVAQKFHLPIRFIGVGESIDDLRVFDTDSFVDAILPADTGIDSDGEPVTA
ncbi:MAG: signal recognition particle-docking protein FtsY [Pseudomonadota bacterium]